MDYQALLFPAVAVFTDYVHIVPYGDSFNLYVMLCYHRY